MTVPLLLAAIGEIWLARQDKHRALGTVGGLAVAAICLGALMPVAVDAVVFAMGDSDDQTVEVAAAHLAVYLLPLIQAMVGAVMIYRSSASVSDMAILRATFLLGSAMMLMVVGGLMFALALALALVVVPVCFSVTSSPSTIHRLVGTALLLAVSPLALVIGALIFRTDTDDIEDAAGILVDFLEEAVLLEYWNLKILHFAYVPLHTIMLTMVWSTATSDKQVAVAKKEE